ncbi:MAG: ATP-dependent DNA helicase RecG [Nitrospirota bacterium]|nr:ATP-dependent DNA helicase RecG [Nitrospirota bacterium]
MARTPLAAPSTRPVLSGVEGLRTYFFQHSHDISLKSFGKDSMPVQPQGPTATQEYLIQLLDRLERPFMVASRLGPRGLQTIKNIDHYISSQIVTALGKCIFSPEIEANMLVLRALFQDTHDQAQEFHKRRLEHGRMLLQELRAKVNSSHGGLGEAASINKSTQIIPQKLASETGGLESTHASNDPEHFEAKVPKATKSTDYRSQHEDQRPLSEIPIQFAKGIGPKRAALLAKLGIKTVEDGLWFLPWRYEDRSQIAPIKSLEPGTKPTISGVIQRTSLRRTRRKGMTIYTIAVRDETGMIEAVFFNQPYLEDVLEKDMRVVLSGPVSTPSGSWNILQLRSPQFEVIDQKDDLLLHVGRIVPIYHETRGLTSRHLRWMIHHLLDHYRNSLEDILPDGICQLYGFPEVSEAIAHAQFPPNGENLIALNSWQTLAHQRLAFEEGFVLQAALAVRQQSYQQETPGIGFDVHTPLVTQLHGKLPFQLTPSQKRVIQDIMDDMKRPHPMNRLIQGDVGAGKTIVALHAMLVACGCGYQAALMAPTEILAEQHFLNIRIFLESLGITVAVMKGGMSHKERANLLEKISTGTIQLIVGTHALIEGGVQFAKLGLVVVDEQHKFGVLQRASLRSKGIRPDVLVMTATPIPRTLAMTVYGDLNVSIIDGLPPGRKPIRTRIIRKGQRDRAYNLVRKEVEAGRQAYIVFPLVDESEKVDLEAAMQAFERLQTEEFPSLRVGLLHGRMKSEEKAEVMAAFKEGVIQVLVATTVIEVGVDVPNASVMVIEHADRFGLAQLHQLRGRVGRGAHQSLCVLISSGGRRVGSEEPSHVDTNHAPRTQSMTKELPLGSMGIFPVRGTQTVTQSAQQRLKAMVTCSDGFAIAEQDLRIRGPGEFLGTRQWGMPEFRVLNLIRDAQLMEQARQAAFALVKEDPHLQKPEHQLLKTVMIRRWQAKLDLGNVG